MRLPVFMLVLVERHMCGGGQTPSLSNPHMCGTGPAIDERAEMQGGRLSSACAPHMENNTS